MSKALLRLFAAGLLLPAGCATPAFIAKWMPGSQTAVAPPPQLAHHAPSQPAPSPPWANSPPAGNVLTRNGGSAPWQTVADQLDRAYQSETAGRLTEARAAYERVLQAEPQHAYANHRLAIIADKEGRFADSERHYTNAYWQNPHGADLLSDWGYSYQLQGRDDLSVRVLQEALKIDGSHRNALFNLGQIYAKNGNPSQALALFQSAGSSEDEAQRALAQITPRNAPGGAIATEPTPGLQNPFLTSNQRDSTVPGQPKNQTNVHLLTGGAPDTTPQYANEHERQLAEFIAKRRAAQEQQDSKRGANLAGQSNRPAAPPPGSSPRPPHIDGTLADHRQLSPEQRQQIALEYLRNNEIHPAETKRRLAELDTQFSNETTQANRPRTVADAPPFSGNNNGQSIWSGDKPWPQAVSSAPAAKLPATPSTLQQYVPQQAPQNPAAWPTPLNSTATTAGAWNDGTANKVSPAGGAISAAAQPATSAVQPGNAWESARAAAAQMGMNAGPGQLFPAAQTPSPQASPPNIPAPQVPQAAIAPTAQMSSPENWPAPGTQYQPNGSTHAGATSPPATLHNPAQYPPGMVITLPPSPHQLQSPSPAPAATQPPQYPHSGQPQNAVVPQIQPQFNTPQSPASQPGQLPPWPGRQ